MQKQELEHSFEALGKREQRFRIISECAPVKLRVVDVEGNSQYMNKKWLKFIGNSEDDISNKIWFEAVHPNDRKKSVQAMQVAIKAQQPFKIEYQARRFDGQFCWLLESAEPNYDADGRLAGYIAYSVDISDRKQADLVIQQSFAELKQHDAQNSQLSEMTSYLQICHSTEELYPVVSVYAKKLFAPHAGLVSLINASKTLVDTVVEWGNSHDSETLFGVNDCWSLRKGERHRAVEIAEGLICKHIKKRPYRPYLCLPMNAYGETLGMVHLQLDNSVGEPKKVADSLTLLASNFANQIGLAIANLRLREALQHQSVRDPLTQLYNRRYLLESFERELARANRNKLPIGVVMIDVDHFKLFNDTYGHDGGDILLREFGSFLKQQCRREDIPCRYGGEEFIILMPGINEQCLLHRCEEIRQKTKQISMSLRGQQLGSISISLGVSLFPQHATSVEGLISAADKALYQAKHAGRDQVLLSQEMSLKDEFMMSIG